MFQSIRNYFATPPRRAGSPLGAGLSDENDDPAIPAFQSAWKDGALVEDMFGPKPFALHGSVGASGADNHRPDVAKVETLLGDAGYYKPMTDSGPNGWHNPNLDSAIRSFQKDKGLQVDGLLKPGGPTITAIGGLFGGAKPANKPDSGASGIAEGEWDWEDRKPKGFPTYPWPKEWSKDFPTTVPTNPWPPRNQQPLPPFPLPEIGQDAPEPTSRPDSAPMPTTFPQGTGLPQGTPAQDQSTQKGQPRLVQGPQIMFSEIPNDPKAYHWYLEYPDGTRVPTSAPPRDQGRSLPDLFPGHTISEAGAREHEDWAKLLKRDAKPEETARILNVAITDHGDQGAADAADLLGRFAQHDPQKAETLRTLVSRQAGRDVPFRIAPLGEGFREPSMEEKLAQAPQSPFGPTDGADMEAAGSMAKALLKKGDYQDAYAYLKSAPEATPPYMAAVHDFMRQENPGLAMKFAEQGVQNGMAKPVQVAQAETGTMSDGVPASAPPPPAPAPTPPEPKPAGTNPQAPTPEPTAPVPNPETKSAPVPAPDRPQAPATAPTPSSPNKTVSGDFLDAIYNAEQGGKVGGQRKPDEKGTGSTEKGMYQINNGGLEAIKWKDKNGNWTAEAARHGVKSDDDFLKSSTAQSVAAQSYFAKKEAVLQDRGAFGSVGQKVKGLKDTFTITDSGLLAAAHREGEKTVEAYLKHQEKNGWTSRFDNLDPQVKADLDIKRKDGTVIRTVEDRFRALETRLRTFEKVKR